MRIEDSLCKVHLSILYEQHGSYLKIVDIVNRTGLPQKAKDKYFVYNIFQSMHMQGIIDVVWEESGIKWCVRKTLYETDKHEGFAFGEELLNSDSCKKKVYSKSQPIGFTKNNKERNSLLDLKEYSSIGDITDFTVTAKSLISLSMGAVEIYSFEEAKWEQKDIEYNESILIRQKDRFSGYRYYVYLLGHSTAFKINDPEWLFIVAAYLLNHDFKSIFIVENQTLKIKSTFRLPALILRFLYNNAEKIQLGYTHEFQDISQEHIVELFDYLFPGSV